MKLGFLTDWVSKDADSFDIQLDNVVLFESFAYINSGTAG
jgi:hypothetical protein